MLGCGACLDYIIAFGACTHIQIRATNYATHCVKNFVDY